MGRAHSKNNTSGSVFTYYERNRTEYGSRTQRLGADSMKRIDSCNLCLARARDPVACGKGGHLYCRECVLGSLLSQKSLLRTHQASLAALEAQEAQEKETVRQEARARVLSDFQKGSGLSGSSSVGAGLRGLTSGGTGEGSSLDMIVPRGTKRKATDTPEESTTSTTLTTTKPNAKRFTFDPNHVESLALAAEEAAIAQITAEQLSARKSKLPSFWLPSLTPETTAKEGAALAVGNAAVGGSLLGLGSGEVGSRIGTVCNIGEVVHPMTMKSLVPAIFTYPSSSNPSSATSFENPSCPSCSREITNSVRTVLLTSKTAATAAGEKDASREGEKEKKANALCGHVVCRTCADTIVKPGKQCVVCEAIIRPDKDMIELAREGTGFAAAGGAEVTKAGIAFQ